MKRGRGQEPTLLQITYPLSRSSTAALLSLFSLAFTGTVLHWCPECSVVHVSKAAVLYRLYKYAVYLRQLGHFLLHPWALRGIAINKVC